MRLPAKAAATYGVATQEEATERVRAALARVRGDIVTRDEILFLMGVKHKASRLEKVSPEVAAMRRAVTKSMQVITTEGTWYSIGSRTRPMWRRR